ncbi:hypothetical protein B0J13DRAFT_620249 [Dactylonectria estremocensis]|uniref:NACHT domain-containing protein n=1 Tax=Dactylonectria estremocensis TaxID=1079267 RepID=A0A9P9F2J7_9HYPO|nr:hypothetical protein B0J13DRAFT_620249 [Dactylonectria estremocensis]
MDVLAAIGLASNLIQFVDCSSKIVKSCWNLWRDDTSCLEENRELEIAVTSLRDILFKLEKDKACSIDDTLVLLIQECSQLTTDLLNILNRLRKRPEKNKVDKIIQTILLSARNLVKQREIEDLKERVDVMRDAVFVRLNFHLHNRRNDLETTYLEGRESMSAIPRSTTVGVTSSTMRDRLNGITKNLDDIEQGRASMITASAQLGQLVRELPSLQQEMTKFNKVRAIISSLHFRQLRERESDVAAAHAQTFEWIFKDCTDVNFKDWLQSDSGLLRSWAQGKILVVAKHFFWSAGPPIQKSQDGMLRTVLFELLLDCPDLAPLLCPQRWNGRALRHVDDWTRSELIECLNNLVSTKELPVHICLFIDGLDEYSGDHVELAKVLIGLTDSPNIKVCTSSRAWVDFLDAFGSNPWKLQVHELTTTDIDIFVADMFKANQQFGKLKSNNPESAEYLTAEIRARAQGVFLWVYLVIRSLLRGLTNEDDMLDLNRRLLQIPVELEDIFRRMLDNIDPIYWQRAARLLQLVKYASGSIPFLTILYFDLDEERKSPRPSLSLKDWPYLDPTTAEMLRVKKRQITAQCKDLLHITASPDLPEPLSEKLGPLHRTVVDFLKTDTIDKLLVERAGSDFEPWTMLFNATTEQIKALVPMSRLVHISRVLLSHLSTDETTARSQRLGSLVNRSRRPGFLSSRSRRLGFLASRSRRPGSLEIRS